jgi:hypothetical protein
MQREQTPAIVSVDLELGEEARFESVQKQAGQGGRVLRPLPLSGGTLPDEPTPDAAADAPPDDRRAEPVQGTGASDV